MLLQASLQHLAGALRAGLRPALILGVILPFAAAQEKAPPTGAPLSPRDQAQNYLENDEARKAVATLVEAARANPADRVIGAMIYAGIRDHVWHLPQALPIAHDAPVHVLAFSPDGDLLASGAESGLLVVSPTEPLDEDAAKARRIELKHDGAIVGAFFSTDGKHLAVASASGGVKIWDVKASQMVFETPKPDSPVTVFASNRPAQLVAIGTADGGVQILDVAAGKLANQPEGAKAKIVDLVFSPDGARLAEAAADQSARVWKTATGKLVGEPMRRPAALTSVDFSYDGRYLFVASVDKKVTAIDPVNGVVVMPALVCRAAIKKVRVSPDGSHVATMLEDGSIKFWDAFTGKELPFDVLEDGQFNDIGWSRSGLRIATASEGNHATLWSARDGSRWGESLPHEAPVLALKYSADGSLLATGCSDGKVRLWRADGGRAMATVRSHRARARTAFYSLDGQHLVTTSEDHTALHWISGQVRPFGPALDHKGKVTCGTFDSAATHILTSDDTGMAMLWDAKTGQPDSTPFVHKSAVNWVDFHPDGKRFVSASGASAFVWSVEHHDKPVAIITHGGKGKSEIKCARFSPDGKWLATASTDGTAQIWDATSYKSATTPIKRGFPVLCVRFSPDSRRLVVAGEDSQATVYETATWKPVGIPVVLPGQVFAAAITADNRFLVASSFLVNAVQFFEIESGRALGPGLTIPSQATCVDYHLQDKVVIVACDDGTVRAYDSPFVEQDVPPWACDFAEHLVGYRKAGPNDFQRVESHFAELAKYAPNDPGGANLDFARLVRWKMTTGTGRAGMPRFISTLAANIEQRVEERSVDAIYECLEAAPVSALAYAALSLYLSNGKQSEFLADMVAANKNAEPLARAFAATTLVSAGRSAEAQELMAAAIAAAPNDPKVLRREAKLNARLQNNELAIVQFDKALALDPHDFETQRSYGWALLHFQRPTDATLHFLLAQEQAGDMVDDLIAGLCLCAAAQKNNSEALAAYRRLVALDPAWKDPAYLAGLHGWAEEELSNLEQVRRALFTKKTK